MSNVVLDDPDDQASRRGLTVLWRDEHLLAVYKPPSWLVHRTALDAGESRWVVQTVRDQLGGRHVWPVHRLDKGTCGVLLLALDAPTAREMGLRLASGAVDKRYLALVRGWLPAALAVDHPLRIEDGPPGLPAQSASTAFRCLSAFDWPESSDGRFPTSRLSLVEACPYSGRRHQIRRHLHHVSHPIVGDSTHGKGPLNRWWAPRLGANRLWLHAWQLAFRHPWTDRPLTLDSGLEWDSGHLRSRSGEPSADQWVEACHRLRLGPDTGASSSSGS